MEDLQIGRRGLDRHDAVPAFHALDSEDKNSHFDLCNKRQIDVMINRLVVI